MSSNANETWNDPRITAYVLDEMSPDERTAFEKEMAADDALAQAVNGASRVTGQLSALFDAEATPPLTDGRRAAIIDKHVIVRPEDEKNGRTTLIAFLAIAATVLACIGLAPLFNQHQVVTVGERNLSKNSDATVTSSVAMDIENEQLSDAVVPSELENVTEEQAHLQSRRNNPLGRKNEAVASKSKPDDLSSLDAEVSNQPIAAGYDMAAPAPFVDRSSLKRNRDRLSRSKLLETEPQSDAAPDIQVRPKGSAEAFGMGSGGMGMQMDMQTTMGMDIAGDEMEMGMGGGTDTMGIDMGGMDMIDGSIQLDASIREESMMMDEMSKLAKKRQLGSRKTAGTIMLGVTPRIIIQEEEELAQTGFDPTIAEGRGPGMSGDRFDPIVENDFIRTADHPLSTFSVDVDTASYSKVRDFLMRANRMPRPDAVRIEEMINYFDYADAPPADDAEHPFAARVNVTECPWNTDHRLARIAIKGKTMKPKDRPACNLVFLLDTSGSMNATNKLPLVVEGMKMLTGQLTKNDKVAIVVYAGSAGLVLDSVPAKKKKKIRRALENLSAGGSTNGGRGIELAYQTAREHFIEGGVNRVILCTDGDFNFGTTGTDSLVRMVEKEAKDDVYLTVLGFGMGNHNDAMLEQISGRGNGNYAFIDNQREAHKVLVKQTAGTLVTIAKDVKLQVDFNPAIVGAYRLIGYENRILAKEDFNDDKKDAGEIGAGHSVTALYELVPPELADKLVKPAVDESKYAAKDKEIQPTPAPSNNDAKKDSGSNETLTVRVRYKQPDADTSTRVDFPATDDGQSFTDSSVDTRFTAAVAGFGMLLRGSQHSGDWELADALKVAQSAIGDDESELRSEFVKLVEKAKQLRGE